MLPGIRIAKYRMPLFYIGLGTPPAVFMAMLLWQIPQSWNLWAAMAIAAAIPLAGLWVLAWGLWNDRKARGRNARV